MLEALELLVDAMRYALAARDESSTWFPPVGLVRRHFEFECAPLLYVPSILVFFVV